MKKSKKLKFQQQGRCPKCGGEDLDYGSTRIEAEAGLGYEFTCNDCETQGVEWYDLKYSETLIDD